MNAPPEIGKTISRSLEREIEEFVLGITNWQRTTGFPGTCPQTLTYADIKKTIQRKKYYVSEKSDGFRYLLLIHQKETYMIDLAFRIRAIPMKFPSGSNPLLPQHQTLIDGELVQDRIEGDKFILRFLVYDIIAYCGKNVMGLPLPDRLKIIQNDIIRPRKADSAHDYSSEPFRVRLKDFYELKHVPWVLNSLIPALPHPNEGLVFTPLDLPYIPGYNKHLFKWKPPHLNSVDFQMGIEWRNRKPMHKLLVTSSESGTLKEFCYIHLAEEVMGQLAQAEGKIIECVWDPTWKTFVPKKGEETWEEGAIWKDGGWKFLRLRPDKKYPNDERTVEIVTRSISDSLTQEKLIKTLFTQDRNPYPSSRKRPRNSYREDSRFSADSREPLKKTASREQIEAEKEASDSSPSIEGETSVSSQQSASSSKEEDILKLPPFQQLAEAAFQASEQEFSRATTKPS